ncbi:hypothetical protein [Thetidibacter halocola]|uniref:Uncharacterized protein n=1 Tax=Thetidibacter halocola TaxID=2827239 RepID=A0A8J8BAN3_9RHOB|nr:hypothetical protein [Thetidibacter halocola]MBS0125388.1 hypothetical protein [Thetidibacter halocola]
MAQDLEEPVLVETGFLELYDAGPEWLRGALLQGGVPGTFEIGDGTVTLTAAAALTLVNRMRAFAEIEFDSLTPAFVLLSIEEAGAAFECATVEPRKILPGITRQDFGVPVFAAPDANADSVERCRVDLEAKTEFVRMGRAALRQEFFNDSGDLKSEHDALTRDPSLAAALIESGYYVTLGDLTGRLKLR